VVEEGDSSGECGFEVTVEKIVLAASLRMPSGAKAPERSELYGTAEAVP